MFQFELKSNRYSHSIHTYNAVTRTDITYLGRESSAGIKVWNPMPIEYVVGAMVAVMLKPSNATRNLSNLPTGESIALRSPPTLPLA